MDPEEKKPKEGKGRKIAAVVLCVLFLLFVFLSVGISAGAKWVTQTYDETTFEQILFNLAMPLNGVDQTLISSAVRSIGLPVLIALLCGAAVYVPLSVIFGWGITFRKRAVRENPETGEREEIEVPAKVVKDNRVFRALRVACWVFFALIFLHGLRYADHCFELFDYLHGQFNSSSYIETHYADPNKTEMTFPEKKRNLIYIFLESMETSFTSKENGGAFDENVIAGLSGMMNDPQYAHFSNTDKLGGAVSTVCATWTMGGMFAQSSGLPLKLPLNYNNKMSTSKTFLDNAACLGDILEEQGYSQAVLMGSVGSFGGRTNYYTIHGGQRVYDLNTASKDGYYPSGYYRNYWGLFDKDLYSYAKQILDQMSKDDAPFALTLLTVDTHFSNGYPCDLCTDFRMNEDGSYYINPEKSNYGYYKGTNKSRKVEHFKYFDRQYSNVYACASEQISAFIEWLKTTPYYENTTIVIAGDHLTMDANYSKLIDESYVRTPMNLFVNSAVQPAEGSTKMRLFSTMDMFPTTLAAMGVKIEGDRLGLGTNLFSGKKTWIEEIGQEAFEEEMQKNSSFYNGLLYAK